MFAQVRYPHLVLAAVMACAVAVLPSGAHAAHPVASRVVLTFYNQWIGVQEQYLKGVIKRFEALHPNIVINETTVADTTKIIAAMEGGKPPDIVDFGLGQYVPELASKGALTNLDPYIQSSHLDMSVYVPAAAQIGQFNGHVYALPFFAFNHGLLYNKQLFKHAGIANPPTTLEQLEADAYRLTKTDKNGKILQMGFIPDWPGGANGQAVNLVDYAWLFGGGWYDSKAQQITADNPANIRALEWETHFYKKYGARNIDNFVKSAAVYLSNDIFASGRLAMAYDGPWWLAFAPKSFVPSIGAAPFPAPAALPQHTGTSYIDADPEVVPSGAAHKAEAFEYIKFETTDRGVQYYMGPHVFNLPQIRSVPGSAISADPRYQVFVKEANGPNAHVFPRLSYAGEMDTLIQNTEAAVLHGQGTPTSALHNLQTQLQNLSSGQ